MLHTVLQYTVKNYEPSCWRILVNGGVKAKLIRKIKNIIKNVDGKRTMLTT